MWSLSGGGGDAGRCAGYLARPTSLTPALKQLLPTIVPAGSEVGSRCGMHRCVCPRACVLGARGLGTGWRLTSVCEEQIGGQGLEHPEKKAQFDLVPPQSLN